MSRRVVITGAGTINALGHDVASTMAAMKEGRCGIGPLDIRDVDRLSIQIGAQVKGYDEQSHFNRQQIALYDRFTQFTLLASLRRFKEVNIAELAEALAIDATTLTRNLDLLVKKGLVENVGMDDGRIRNLRLSDLGNKTFEEALPLWQEAQHQVLVALEPEPWYVLRAQLGKIEAFHRFHRKFSSLVHSLGFFPGHSRMLNAFAPP